MSQNRKPQNLLAGLEALSAAWLSALTPADAGGGPGRPGTTNPEALFAARYAAGFENALLRVAREGKVRLDGSSEVSVA